MQKYDLSYWHSMYVRGADLTKTKWLNFAGRNYDKGLKVSLEIFNDFINEQHDDWLRDLHVLHMKIETEFTRIMKKRDMTIPLSHLIWGRVYVVACYCMHDDENWVKNLLPLMEQMESDTIVRNDMKLAKRLIAERCWPKSLLAKHNNREVIKLEKTMNNENLTFEKMKLMGQYACLRVTPYREFKDGTKGSVLLLRFNCTDSLLFLFNSPDRAEESDYGKSNNLYPSELDQFYAYRQECCENNDEQYRSSKELYEKFGVVILAGEYATALIADRFCANVNSQDEKRRSNWQTDRVPNLFTKARTECWLYMIEDTIKAYLSEDFQWQRSIVMQALSLYSMDKMFDEYLHMDWYKVRLKYAEWVGQNYIKVKLYFAQQVLAAYRNSEQPIDWLRLLEDVLRNQREYKMEFRHLDYGVQEIVGLYALSKYLYTVKPKQFELHYAEVEMGERIALYGEYLDQCKQEMLAQLNAKDDPTRSTLPTEEEAEKKAKLHIGQLIGRVPYKLPNNLKGTYALYEQGFCFSLGIKHPNTPTAHHEEGPKTPEPIQAAQPEPFKPDFTTEFLPFYTMTPDYNMLMNVLKDDRDKVSDTDWARYALTIYRCKKIFRCYPESFKVWLPKFCSLSGREVKYRAPSDLKRSPCGKDISIFLPMLNVESM